jgi:dipeptidyl aminopeptidase/acylaminoacyl peptidase
MAILRSRTARFLTTAMLLVAPAGLAHAAQHVPFSIADVLHAPYPTSLITAAKGNAVAWVFDDAGVRNIWVANGAEGAGHPITTYKADDGFDIGDLAWSPDTRLLAFVRGQTLEDDKPANVDSTPAGPMPREIWVVPAEGGAPRKIGAGHSPSFSPDGSRLIFLDKNRIMSVDPSGAGEPKPLLTDMGGVRSALWSPDGRRLAFVSSRGSHALVGIYDLSAKTITWLDPTYDLDMFPAFSPDGTRIAFIRVPSEKSSPFLSRRAGLPWSIRVADVATGEGREIWKADPGDGSIFQPTLSEHNLLWTADNHLVFPWEKTGWLLPYAVSATGGTAHALASGGFETAYMTLGADRRKLVYASNQGDIDRLHLWAVDPAGGTPQPVVAQDKGIEAYPAVGADGSVFALRSTATTQLMPVVAKAGGWQPLAAGATPAAFPSSKLVTPESVTFQAPDGQTTYGQLFLPPAGTGNGKHPAVLFFHGGPPRQMLVGFHYMSAYSWMYALNEYLAAKGYVVLSVNYRGGIGYGMNYREAKGFGMGGGSETNDIFGAITYLKGRADVDGKRLGVWGGSYGGLMTALTLARASDSVAVGVDYAGVYNWASMIAAEGRPIEDPKERDLAIASSPIATIDKWRSPVLVVQADDDRNVPPQQSAELIRDLRAHNVPFDQILMPNEVHDLTRYASWLALFQATDAYLDRYLHPETVGK